MRAASNPFAIAVNNEGNIYVNQNGAFTGVVEIPNPLGASPVSCSELTLKKEPGYAGGIAVDSKTDDLVVLDDPDFCAGGIEGRITIYPQPYDKSTGVSHNLEAHCAGAIRLDATSKVIFAGDETVSGAQPYILQRSFPDGKDMGTYSGGNPGGFTTIPNALPN